MCNCGYSKLQCAFFTARARFLPQRREERKVAQGVYKVFRGVEYFNVHCGLIDFGMSISAEYLNEISSIILKSSIAVHKEMGPGLLEGVYQQCMISNCATGDWL